MINGNGIIIGRCALDAARLALVLGQLGAGTSGLFLHRLRLYWVRAEEICSFLLAQGTACLRSFTHMNTVQAQY